MAQFRVMLCVLLVTSSVQGQFTPYSKETMHLMTDNFLSTPELIMNIVIYGLPSDLQQRFLSSPQYASMISGQRPVEGQTPVNASEISNDAIIIGRKKRSFGSDPFGNDVLASFGFHPSSSGGSNTNSGFNSNSGFFNSGSHPSTTTTIPRVCPNTLPNCGFIIYPSDPTDILPPATATATPTTTKGGFINYPTGSNSHPFNSGSSGKFASFSFGNQLVCPRQIDQGLVYQYSADNSTYPAVDIANELFVRSLPGSDLLFQCLSRQIIFPDEPPQIFPDVFLGTANATCPKVVQQLWSYESFVYTGRCYPLVNFQEIAVYKTCLKRFCDCQQSNSFSNKKNLCVTEYRQISIWAYCPALVANRRIVRDRILVPESCTCATVECESSGGFGSNFGHY